MSDMPQTTSSEIRFAIATKRFQRASPHIAEAYAGCEGECWIFEPSEKDETVVADCQDGGVVAIQVHNYEGSWAYCPIREIFIKL